MLESELGFINKMNKAFFCFLLFFFIYLFFM